MKTPALILAFVVALTTLGLTSCALFPKSDYARLQGNWVGPDTAPNHQGNCQLLVTGRTLEFRGSRTNEWYQGTFVVNPKNSPRQLVVTIMDCAMPQLVGLQGNAIYKFEGSVLTVTGWTPGKQGFPEGFGASDAQTVSFTKTP